MKYIKKNLSGLIKKARLRPPEYLTDVLSMASVDEENGTYTITQENWNILANKYPPRGPGTELKKLLSESGLVETPSCSCNSRTAEMDRRGIAWCESNLPTIIGWLRGELVNRGATAKDLIFFDNGVGESIVREAIKRAKISE